jgi:hypothetical protein
MKLSLSDFFALLFGILAVIVPTLCTLLGIFCPSCRNKHANAKRSDSEQGLNGAPSDASDSRRSSIAGYSSNSTATEQSRVATGLGGLARTPNVAMHMAVREQHLSVESSDLPTTSISASTTASVHGPCVASGIKSIALRDVNDASEERMVNIPAEAHTRPEDT